MAPILQTLILNRDPEAVLAWADRVTAWSFTTIIPCHLESPVRARPADFRAAFSFLEEPGFGAPSSPVAALEHFFRGAAGAKPRPMPVAADLAALENAEEDLVVLVHEAPED